MSIYRCWAFRVRMKINAVEGHITLLLPQFYLISVLIIPKFSFMMKFPVPIAACRHEHVCHVSWNCHRWGNRSSSTPSLKLFALVEKTFNFNASQSLVGTVLNTQLKYINVWYRASPQWEGRDGIWGGCGNHTFSTWKRLVIYSLSHLKNFLSSYCYNARHMWEKPFGSGDKIPEKFPSVQ